MVLMAKSLLGEEGKVDRHIIYRPLRPDNDNTSLKGEILNFLFLVLIAAISGAMI